MSVVDAYASGVLKEDVHSRLVGDIDRIAQDAAIQPHWIWTPLADRVSPAEMDWVKGFRQNPYSGITGMCLIGAKAAKVEDRMSAIAGALLRNFIRAQVLTLTSVIEYVDKNSAPEATCLLIPNFFHGKAMGGSLPAWKIALLHDLLLERHLAGLQTVVYVSDPHALATEYGPLVWSLIEAHYTPINLG